jgi:hypothetical protein
MDFTVAVLYCDGYGHSGVLFSWLFYRGGFDCMAVFLFLFFYCGLDLAVHVALI